MAARPLAASFEDGVDAYKRGDYKAALDEWLAQAATNDARALFNIGQLYRMGRGVEKDLQKAEQYYRRAAHLGHIGAHGNLGSLYYDKQPPDVENALYYWRLAAKGGDPRAQYLYGVQYFNGDHMARDYVLAYGWVSLAAKAGLVDAQAALTSMMSYMDAEDIAEGERMAGVLLNPDERDAMRQAEMAARDARPTEVPPDPNLVTGGVDTGQAPKPRGRAVAAVAGADQGQSQDGQQPRDDGAEDLVVQLPGFDPDGPPAVAQAQLPPPLPPGDTAGQTKPDGTETGTETGIGITLVEADTRLPPSPADQRPAATGQPSAVTGIFRAQLASLQTEAEIRAAWLKLRADQPILFDGRAAWVEIADLGARGQFRRLKVGPYASAAQAQAVCDILAEQGQPCLQTVAREGDILLNTTSAAVATLSPTPGGDVADRAGAPVQGSDDAPDALPPPASGDDSGPGGTPPHPIDMQGDNTGNAADNAGSPAPDTGGPGGEGDAVAQDQAQDVPPPSGVKTAAATGTHRVQLASFPDPDKPLARWERLQKQAVDLLGSLRPHVVPVDLGERGTYYRLYVGPFGQQAANDLCASLKEQNVDCLVSRVTP